MHDFIRSMSTEDLVFYLIIVGSICMLFLFIWRRKRTHGDFVEAAQAMGFLSTPWEAQDINTTILNFKLYTKRSMLDLGPIVHKKRHDFNLTLFNVRMLWSNSNTRHPVTVAHVRLHDQTLPDFVLQTPPLLLLSIFKNERMVRRIRFDGHPKFMRYFWLSGDDEQVIRAFFTPRIISFLERKTNVYQKLGLKLGPIGLGARFPCLEAVGNEFIFFFESKTIAPQKLQAFIDETEEIIQALTGPKKRAGVD